MGRTWAELWEPNFRHTVHYEHVVHVHVQLFVQYVKQTWPTVPLAAHCDRIDGSTRCSDSDKVSRDPERDAPLTRTAVGDARLVPETEKRLLTEMATGCRVSGSVSAR